MGCNWRIGVRAASSHQRGTYYYKFKMKKGLPSNLEFEYAEAIPWFKLQGTADQIRSSEKFSEISGHIEIIEVLKFEKGKSKN